MEMINEGEGVSLIGELKQGRELANQLKNQLEDPILFIKSMEISSCEELLEKIVSSYDKALSFLAWNNNNNSYKPSLKRKSFEFSSSHSSSPITPTTGYSSDRIVSKHDYSKKRKTLPKWREQVRVCSGIGQEGPVDDGYNWRKYGQKDILGAIFPRSYYRCTHRYTQGCLATKQVQKSEEDSSMFVVTYKGRHSCVQTSNSTSKTASIQKEIFKPNKPLLVQENQDIQRLEDGLKVETKELKTREEIFPLFSFPYTQIEQENVENQLLMSCYSPNSESNFFASPWEDMNNFIIGSILEKSSVESDATNIATPNSVTNDSSPFGDLEISIDDQVNFDPYIPLDTLAYFS